MGFNFFKLLAEKKIGEQGFFGWGNLILGTTLLRARFLITNCLGFGNWAGRTVETFVDFFLSKAWLTRAGHKATMCEI